MDAQEFLCRGMIDGLAIFRLVIVPRFGGLQDGEQVSCQEEGTGPRRRQQPR